jgi:nucleoside-diphosphate-sugar epimerase
VYKLLDTLACRQNLPPSISPNDTIAGGGVIANSLLLIASAAKIRAELGWAPQYPTVEQIIASAWEWHSRHPRGYQS